MNSILVCSSEALFPAPPAVGPPAVGPPRVAALGAPEPSPFLSAKSFTIFRQQPSFISTESQT